jgi:hypothetical protein
LWFYLYPLKIGVKLNNFHEIQEMQFEKNPEKLSVVGIPAGDRLLSYIHTVSMNLPAKVLVIT